MAIRAFFLGSNRAQSFVGFKRWATSIRAFCNTSETDYVIGINLGNTNSRVALLEGQVPSVIIGGSGRATPSFVAINREKDILVGQSAQTYAMFYPEHSFFKMKNLIGRNFDFPQTQKFMRTVPYEIFGASNGEAHLRVENKELSPSEVCAHILRKTKETSERYLMKPISKAVIAVPVYFDDAQRRHLEAAGRIANLDVIGIIDEPVAVAISSCKSMNDGMVAVLDLGGSTFSVTILKMSNGIIQVEAKNYDEFFGGEAFDHAIVHYFVEEIKKIHSLDVSGDGIAMMRLKEAAEKAKVELSFADFTVIYIDSIGGTVYKPIHLDFKLSRSEFEVLVNHLMENIRIGCENCLKDARISSKEVKEVLFVGGMARVPLLQRVVQEIFGKPPIVEMDPDEAVVNGAAMHGGLIIEDGKELLPNVAPLSIGVETLGGIFMRIIDRNTKLPAKASRIFTTEYDNQASMLLRIFQGEREMVSDNKLIGEVELKGIPPAPHSVPRIVVTFNIDQKGVLSICTHNKDTGKECVVKIQSPTGLSDQYTKKVVKEALLYGRLDMMKASLTDLRSMGKIFIHRLGNLLVLRKQQKKIDEGAISYAEKSVAALKVELDSDNESVTRYRIGWCLSAINRLESERPNGEYYTDDYSDDSCSDSDEDW